MCWVTKKSFLFEEIIYIIILLEHAIALNNAMLLKLIQFRNNVAT